MLRFETSGQDRLLRAEAFLPRPLSELWAFFSAAENLSRLTPPWLSFKIVTPTPIDMHEGRVIDYRIGLKGIPMRWRSLISVWEPPVSPDAKSARFVDEQLKGPYKKWHHEHLFEAVDGGTLCRDVVHYRVPFDGLTHGFLVQPDLQKIFNYRQAVMTELFGAPVGAAAPEPVHA